MQGLAGKTAIVTGASRGIGRAIAVELSKNKVNIAFNFVKDEQSARSLETQLKANGVGVCCASADIKNDAEIQEFVTAAKAKFTRIDFLVNNAGILKDKSLVFMNHTDWNDVLDTNLSGTFRVTKLLIPSFLKQGG